MKFIYKFSSDIFKCYCKYCRIVLSIFFLFLLTAQFSCKKLVAIEPPVTSTNEANVYTNNATAAAVLTGIFAQMSAQNISFVDGGITSLSLFLGLSADEIALFNLSNMNLLPYYTNQLTNVSAGSADFWSRIYPFIFYANSAIEALSNSTTLTATVRQQLLGEAKFIRAFCYFYLVNLYGDVPLVISTNYATNAALARTSKTEVWQQIIEDLKEAQNLLSPNYLKADILGTTTERVRPTEWAATALLARTYLYTSDWANAEAEATKVINNSAQYDTVALNNVFLKNSKEAIWQLQPVGSGTNSNTGEGRLFILPATGPSTFIHEVYLSNHIVNSFEPNDERKNIWVNSVTTGGTTYYYPYKYKIGSVDVPTSEYIMVLRLAEQYLIRAEARAQQNNISGAQSDLNVIRTRAGLPNTTAATKADLLTAILQERKVELFTEWGHRWLDLKRTGMANAVMSVVTPPKGGTWETTDQLYPIILPELQRNPNLVQNPGYN